MARIVGSVAAVVVTMTLLTGVMISAIPSHVRARAIFAPVRHVENCRPYDQWIAEARRDLEHGRPRGALHELALSRRDCGEDAERDRLEALAYDAVGDKFAAIAAASRWLDATQDERAQQLIDELTH
jgi:hypothetical protein